jgi:RNA recognition motif-containing protein
MNIYVSNISFHTTEELLNEMFSKFGAVKAVKIVTDKNTGITRGFGFVEMTSMEEAFEAINKLDGKEIQGRALRVSQAKDSFAQAVKATMNSTR